MLCSKATLELPEPSSSMDREFQNDLAKLFSEVLEPVIAELRNKIRSDIRESNGNIEEALAKIPKDTQHISALELSAVPSTIRTDIRKESLRASTVPLAVVDSALRKTFGKSCVVYKYKQNYYRLKIADVGVKLITERSSDMEGWKRGTLPTGWPEPYVRQVSLDSVLKLRTKGEDANYDITIIRCSEHLWDHRVFAYLVSWKPEEGDSKQEFMSQDDLNFLKNSNYGIHIIKPDGGREIISDGCDNLSIGPKIKRFLHDNNLVKAKSTKQ